MVKTKPFTATEVKQAKPKLKNRKLVVNKLSDGEGLPLRVNPNGAKTWLLDFIKPLHPSTYPTCGYQEERPAVYVACLIPV